jgi:hypothetical protein
MLFIAVIRRPLATIDMNMKSMTTAEFFADGHTKERPVEWCGDTAEDADVFWSSVVESSVLSVHLTSGLGRLSAIRAQKQENNETTPDCRGNVSPRALAFQGTKTGFNRGLIATLGYFAAAPAAFRIVSA